MPTRAYVVKEMHVLVGAVDYQCEVSGVSLTPSASTQTIALACPDGVVSDVGRATWALTISYTSSLQANALFRMLAENDGEAATVSFEPFPVAEAGHKITAEVILAAGGADWTVGNFNTGTVTLPMTAPPTGAGAGPTVTAGSPTTTTRAPKGNANRSRAWTLGSG